MWWDQVKFLSIKTPKYLVYGFSSMFSSLIFNVMLVISFFRVEVNKTKLDLDILRESLLAVSQLDTSVNSLLYFFFNHLRVFMTKQCACIICKEIEL